MRSMARQKERKNIKKLRNNSCMGRSLVHLCFGQTSTALVGCYRYSLVTIDSAKLINTDYG